MSVSQIESFKQLFVAFQPRQESPKDRDDGIEALHQQLEVGADRVKQIRGEGAYGKNGGGSLADIRDEADAMFFAWPDLEWRWGEMETPKVKGALDGVGKSIAELKQKVETAPFVTSAPGTPSKDELRDQEIMRGLLKGDIEQLERMHKTATDQLEARKSKKTGDRTPYSKEVEDGGQTKVLLQGWNSKAEMNEWHTEEEWNDLKAESGEHHLTGNTDGLLLEGWNGVKKKLEWHSKEEWQHLDDRLGVALPKKETSSDMIKLKVVTGTFNMKATEPRQEQDTLTPFGTVLLQKKENQFVGAFEVYNKWERNASQKMREGLSGSLNDRVKGDNPALKKGVENNCDMASKLASLLAPDPTNPDFKPEELFQQPGKDVKGGILCRIVGSTVNQGGFAPEDGKPVPKPETVMAEILKAADNLKKGAGQPGDANKITQFIAAFIDGVTEINEGNEVAKKQLDVLWSKFAAAFGLREDDKAKLLARVDGYKEIAGGIADTLSGKGGRKAQTRQALMPNDPEYKIDEEDALIGGDISGSMQSQLLAQELAGSLLGDSSGNKGIKGRGEPVQVTDKAVLNARVLDALSLTAGGVGEAKGRKGDVVFHTGWEMINGMRGITGAPEIDQMTATQVMISMGRGTSFTDAMEAVIHPSKLPWAGRG